MKKQYYIILGSILLTCVLSLVLFLYVPYYRNDEGLYMTVLDADMRTTSMIIINIVFVFIAYLISILIAIYRRSALEVHNYRYYIKMIPLTPAVMLSVWFILSNVLSFLSEYHYRRLGSDFISANGPHYSGMTFSVDDLDTLGRSLSYGVGFYLVIVVCILYVVHALWFHKNYDVLFRKEKVQ